MASITLIQKTFHAMGGQFIFSCYAQEEKKLSIYALFDLAFLEIQRIEDKFTDHRPSYFNQINDNAGINKVKVDDETMLLIDISAELFRKSNKLFDISFASIGHQWREYQKRKEKIPEHIIKEKLSLVNFNLIEIDKINKTIFLPFSEMRIGFGGIGKGYAVDQAFKILRENNLNNFCINGSGDIRVYSEENALRKWQIGIRNPLSKNTDRAIGIIQLSNGAVATSGGYNNHIETDKNDHHIINPLTGRSRSDIIQSTIIANDAITADTNATIIINQNPKNALDYLNDNKICGLFIDQTGMSHLSKMAQDFFKNSIH